MTFPSTKFPILCADAKPFDIDNIVEPFEGPEKTLEIEFPASFLGLRSIPREIWDAVIMDAGATILDQKSNAHGDTYLLSESSLFVFNDKVVIKTCGTTTLLFALPKLIIACQERQLPISWITYCRKNFQFPHDQREPHRTFDDEVSYLSSHVSLSVAQPVGPEDSDHMFLCTSKVQDSQLQASPACTLTMMMYGLHPSAASQFVKSAEIADGPTMTTKSGIRDLFFDALIHEWAFDPCGYSMNALLEEPGAYATVHVTPQHSCSYASFETNTNSCSYLDLTQRVLEIFRPTRFTMSVLQRGKWVNQDETVPVYEKSIVTPTQEFICECVNQLNPDADRCFYVANFSLRT